LAVGENVPLYTLDKRILRAFPEFALRPE
jgi:hypothetical protein